MSDTGTSHCLFIKTPFLHQLFTLISPNPSYLRAHPADFTHPEHNILARRWEHRRGGSAKSLAAVEVKAPTAPVADPAASPWPTHTNCSPSPVLYAHNEQQWPPSCHPSTWPCPQHPAKRSSSSCSGSTHPHPSPKAGARGDAAMRGSPAGTWFGSGCFCLKQGQKTALSCAEADLIVFSESFQH